MKSPKLYNPTARELLAFAAGDKHELHSVADWKRTIPNTVLITCSCDVQAEVETNDINMKALRNAPHGNFSVPKRRP